MKSQLPYGVQFYDNQRDGSLIGASRILPMLWSVLRPKSVIDLGCGAGAWLSQLKQLGTDRVCGIDGPWLESIQLADPNIELHNQDLEQLNVARLGSFDLAMSIEVAEHLSPEGGDQLIQALTDLSDVVVFGAAFSGQGGIGHINCQPHSHWASTFAQRGYRPYDFFRPRIWGDGRIPYWYRQNLFLYVRKGTEDQRTVEASGQHELGEIAFMDCVHPEMFLAICQDHERLQRRWTNFTRFIPSPLKALAHRIRGKDFGERSN